MSQPAPREDSFSTVLPQELRKAAAECKDPAQRASLLEQAEKMEVAERRLDALASSGHEALERLRGEIESRRRSYELPGWVVVTTLLAFTAFLVLVALKHYV
jgi:hypothetical protein